MRRMTAIFVAVLLIFGLSTAAMGQILVEDFDYPGSTSLNGQGGWSAHSGAGTNPPQISSGGLSYTGYPSSAIGNAVSFTTTGEDNNKLFSTFPNGTASGSLYYAVMVRIDSASLTGDYFFHLLKGTTTFTARAFVKRSSNNDNLAFGVGKASTIANINFSDTVYAKGTTHLLVVKYTYIDGATNDTVALWINPTIGASEPSPTVLQSVADRAAADLDTLYGVAVRQGTAANASMGTLDGIRVGTTWESVIMPSTGGDPTPATQGLIYASTGQGPTPGNLLTVDTTSGAGTLLGSSSLGGIPGLAIRPSDGMVFGVSANSQANGGGRLYILDAVTAETTLVGNTGLSFLDAIAFGPGDSLYGIDGSFNLHRINTTTAATTLIGNTGDVFAGLAFDPTTGILYGSIGGFQPVAPDAIFTINPSTGAKTLVGTTGLGGTYGNSTPDIAFDQAGNMYGVKGGGSSVNVFFSINKSTGAGSVIGDSIGYRAVSGLASYVTFGPPPSPPAITNIARSTRVPGAGDSLVVTCTITHSVGVSAAKLMYAVNGTADSVAMTLTSGTAQNGTYRGVIPGSANGNGNRIEYRIQANGTGGSSTTTLAVAANSYYAGISPLSLTGLRRVDGTGKLIDADYSVRVTGTVNGPNFQTTNIGYHFQDAFGGIQLFSFNILIPPLNLGDSIIVTGKIAQFRGLTEVVPDTQTTDVQVVATGRTVTPVTVTVPQFYTNPELYESRLVRIVGLDRNSATPPWPGAGSSANIIMFQDVPTDTIIVRIDSDTQIPGSPEPAYPVDITGVISQFSSSSTVYNNGYQTQPRYLTDFVTPPLGFFDDFESYTAGQRLACQNPTDWTTWSITPCNTTEDALISANFAFSGTKSVVVTQNNDLVKRHGSLTTGRHVIEFNVYIPTGKAGYFNTLAGFTPNTFNWGMEAYFDATGAGRLFAGAATATPFTFAHNTWHTVRVVVDLGQNMGEFIFNGSLIRSWQWTLGASGGGSPLRLDANNWYGATANDEMYFDNYHFYADTATVGVEEDDPQVPVVFALAQNYPNPFNPSTSIKFALPTESNVSLTVFNILGQHIATLFEGEHQAGNFTVEWNGVNRFGAPAASGIYFYRIEARPTDGASPFVSNKKMILMK